MGRTDEQACKRCVPLACFILVVAAAAIRLSSHRVNGARTLGTAAVGPLLPPAAAMDVDHFTHHFPDHGRALDVPACSRDEAHGMHAGVQEAAQSIPGDAGGAWEERGQIG